MSEESFTFQTEVGRLLDIVAHSLYSHKEIFLRELISNASDACDRLRYLALSQPELVVGGGEFCIRLLADRSARTLSIADNGVGMNRDDLIETLGTIARSGSQAFLSHLAAADGKPDLALIGQFGVGFYSAFMVADKVEVLTRKAGEEGAWLWSSDGKGSFTIAEATRPERGTTVILHLKEGEDEFLEEWRLRDVVKKYSDHISFPIRIGGKDDAPASNAASSLWTRPKKDITEEQYKEFYHHVGHVFDEPWLTLHNQVEGVVSYTNLLFIPASPPFDLFHPERKGHVKLYVRRVFITDDCEGLLPHWLRFLRGVVDCEDLPLNISRETFQHDPRLAKIKSSLTKRVLDDLAKKADSDPKEYATFWTNFGAVLKEGIYEDFENRDRLLSLARFASTAGDALTSLDAYIERMRPGQEAIYTISGEQVEALRGSPQLEGFRARGIEVLLLTDPVDEFWIPAVRTYKDKPFRSAATAGTDLSAVPPAEGTETPPADAAPDGLDALLARFRTVLEEQVKDVKASSRLTDSPVCLVAAEGDMDMYLERLLKQHRGRDGVPGAKRILEVNPTHPLVIRLAAMAAVGASENEATLADYAHLLFDQATIIEGEPLADAHAFARRLATVMAKGLPTFG